MTDDAMTMYEELAGWFHLLTPPSDYADEAAELMRVLERFGSPPLGSVLELGAGGGNLASHLSGQHSMTLTDISPAMLAVSRTVNPHAEHLVGDMRDLRLGRTFDAVIVHDAIVYMTNEADLRAALRTAFVHLRPGGAAAFLPDWVLDSYTPRTESGGGDEGRRGLRYLEWDREVEADGHTVRTDYVIVTRDGAEVRVHHDVHVMGIFPRASWLRLLGEAGFDAHRVVGAEQRDIFVGVRPPA